MHAIKSDLKTGIIDAEFIGFWERDDVARFVRDLCEHAERIAETGKGHMLLIDYSRASIQAQDIVAALANQARFPAYRARRVAAFTTGRLAKLQARRIAALRDDMAMFDDRASALAWLMELHKPHYCRSPAAAAMQAAR